MIYGYARVSTVGQKNDGNGLEVQERELKKAGAVKVYSDSFTGTKMKRPELQKLLDVLVDGDTLIVTKLDRVARSAMQGVELVETLIEKGVRIHILNMGILDNTPASKLMRTVFFAFAEFERDMIVERTQEGKAIKKAKGELIEGRKKLDVPEFPFFFEKVKSGDMTVITACKELGISRASWYNLVNGKAV